MVIEFVVSFIGCFGLFFECEIKKTINYFPV
jgi:hypothetical protein